MQACYSLEDPNEINWSASAANDNVPWLLWLRCVDASPGETCDGDVPLLPQMLLLL